MKEIKNFNLNFGPQHPAAHGVLRLVLQLNGEKIIKSDAHIGLLHRGTEKLIEQKSVTQALPYLDRLDYVSMFCNEHVFSQAIEKNAFLNIGFKNQNTRVILLELTRILNHLMCITTHVMDVGALTPFLWGFEEREKIMEIYERLSGARMHAAYIRPGGEITQFPKDVLANIINFYKDFFSRIEEISVLLSKNRVLIKRLSNVGVINEKTATMYSLTGPLIRSIGLPVDLRITNPYECYKILGFKTIIAKHGDTYARYFLRIEEMKESLKIIKACIENITELKEGSEEEQEMNPNKNFFLKQNMEEIIQHFEKNAKGFSLNADESFCCVESPKGVLGVFLGANKSRRIYRCKFRTPGFFHLQAFDAVSKTHSLSDAVAIIGTKDIVFGEVDR